MGRYRFKRDSSPAEEVRRVALAQLECAVEEISQDDPDSVKRIHSLRKRFKKLRSLFRLIDAADRDFARRENDRFRELGRLLSSRRDADVMLSTIDALSDDPKDGEDFYPSVRKRLSDARDSGERPDSFDQLEQGLQEAREAMLSWSPPEISWRELVDAFAAQYRRGRKAFRSAQRDASSEAMHEWRKRTKDHWYQMRLLRDFWKGSRRRRIKRLRKLATLLGEDHDLAVLDSRCDRKPKSKREARELSSIRKQIARRRKRLRRASLKLGQKIFGLKRKTVRRRMSGKRANDAAVDAENRLEAVASGHDIS